VRYLTPEREKEIKDEFNEILASEPQRLDKEIVPYLIEINGLEGVATVMSCVGHHGDTGCSLRAMGYLLLFLNEEKSKRFYETMDRMTILNSATRIFMRYEWDCTLRRYTEKFEITFQGMDCGEEAFRTSMVGIVSFLKSL